MKATKDPASAPYAVDSRSEIRDLGEIIARHPFLKGLDPHQCRILKDCAMFIRFAPGECVFREGDPANRFYLLQRGKVSVESHIPGQGTTPIQTLQGGDVLGWSWMFPPFYWHFDARAVEATEAVFFYGTPLLAECEADHHLGYELLKRTAEVMLQRLQSTRRKLTERQPAR